MGSGVRGFLTKLGKSEDGRGCGCISGSALKAGSFLRGFGRAGWGSDCGTFLSLQVRVRPSDLGHRRSVPAGPRLAGQRRPGACECGGALLGRGAQLQVEVTRTRREACLVQ